MVDLRTISKLTSKLNIKKRARIGPPAKCHLNGILWAKAMWVRHSVPAGFTCHDLHNEERERECERELDRLPLFSHSCTPGFKVLATAYTMKW